MDNTSLLYGGAGRSNYQTGPPHNASRRRSALWLPRRASMPGTPDSLFAPPESSQPPPTAAATIQISGASAGGGSVGRSSGTKRPAEAPAEDETPANRPHVDAPTSATAASAPPALGPVSLGSISPVDDALSPQMVMPVAGATPMHIAADGESAAAAASPLTNCKTCRAGRNVCRKPGAPGHLPPGEHVQQVRVQKKKAKVWADPAAAVGGAQASLAADASPAGAVMAAGAVTAASNCKTCRSGGGVCRKPGAPGHLPPGEDVQPPPREIKKKKTKAVCPPAVQASLAADASPAGAAAGATAEQHRVQGAGAARSAAAAAAATPGNQLVTPGGAGGVAHPRCIVEWAVAPPGYDNPKNDTPDPPTAAAAEAHIRTLVATWRAVRHPGTDTTLCGCGCAAAGNLPSNSAWFQRASEHFRQEFAPLSRAGNSHAHTKAYNLTKKKFPGAAKTIIVQHQNHHFFPEKRSSFFKKSSSDTLRFGYVPQKSKGFTSARSLASRPRLSCCARHAPNFLTHFRPMFSHFRPVSTLCRPIFAHFGPCFDPFSPMFSDVRPIFSLVSLLLPFDG